MTSIGGPINYTALSCKEACRKFSSEAAKPSRSDFNKGTTIGLYKSWNDDVGLALEAG